MPLGVHGRSWEQTPVVVVDVGRCLCGNDGGSAVGDVSDDGQREVER
jgi:hypothetical protein